LANFFGFSTGPIPKQGADRDNARDVRNRLARLKVGEGWIWAPDHRLFG
jgi:hypothetical protein